MEIDQPFFFLDENARECISAYADEHLCAALHLLLECITSASMICYEELLITTFETELTAPRSQLRRQQGSDDLRKRQEKAVRLPDTRREHPLTGWILLGGATWDWAIDTLWSGTRELHQRRTITGGEFASLDMVRCGALEMVSPKHIGRLRFKEFSLPTTLEFLPLEYLRLQPFDAISAYRRHYYDRYRETATWTGSKPAWWRALRKMYPGGTLAG